MQLSSSGNLRVSGDFGSFKTVTISVLNTGYQIGQGAFSGIVVARDNTYGGTGLWVQDPNGNGGVGILTTSSFVNGAYSIYFSGGITYIQKTSGSVPVEIAYSILNS
jgi:hypothetical protein